jgi:inner membrane protein
MLVTIASMDIMPIESAALLAALGGWFGWTAGRLSPRARAFTALTTAAVIVLGLLATSRGARAELRHALQPHLRGRLVDLILTPNPSSPLCWAVIAIESIETDDEFLLWRGTLSLAPGLKAPTACASHRFFEAGVTRTVGGGHLVLDREIRQSLRQWRELSRTDCRVRAWLRFGRAPVIASQQMFDLRFAGRQTRNFTHMPLTGTPAELGCPSFVPDWEMPRKDLFTSTSLVFQKSARTLRGLAGSSRWSAGS